MGGPDGHRSVVLVSSSMTSNDISPCPYVKLTSCRCRHNTTYCLGDYLEGAFSNDQCNWRLPRAQICRSGDCLRCLWNPHFVLSCDDHCSSILLRRDNHRSARYYAQKAAIVCVVGRPLPGTDHFFVNEGHRQRSSPSKMSSLRHLVPFRPPASTRRVRDSEESPV